MLGQNLLILGESQWVGGKCSALLIQVYTPVHLRMGGREFLSGTRLVLVLKAFTEEMSVQTHRCR